MSRPTKRTPELKTAKAQVRLPSLTVKAKAEVVKARRRSNG